MAVSITTTYTENSPDGLWNVVGLSADMDKLAQECKVPNGSTFYAMDTGQVFMWDGENESWLEQ